MHQEKEIVLTQLPSNQDEINRKRSNILILTGVSLGLSILSLILTCMKYGNIDSSKYQYSGNTAELILTLPSIIYYSFGIFAAHRLSRISLLIFAWIGLLFLLAYGAIVIIILVTVITVLSASADLAGAAIIFAVVFILICVSAVLLQIFTVRYAFQLAKLLYAIPFFGQIPNYQVGRV